MLGRNVVKSRQMHLQYQGGILVKCFAQKVAPESSLVAVLWYPFNPSISSSWRTAALTACPSVIQMLGCWSKHLSPVIGACKGITAECESRQTKFDLENNHVCASKQHYLQGVGRLRQNHSCNPNETFWIRVLLRLITSLSFWESSESEEELEEEGK